MVDVTRSPALAEEVANRGFDARVLLVVPVHSENEVSARVGVVVVERTPDVGDDSGVIHRRESDRRSRRNRNIVGIAAGLVVTRNSVRRCVDELGDVRQGALTHLSSMLLPGSVGAKFQSVAPDMPCSPVTGKVS